MERALINYCIVKGRNKTHELVGEVEEEGGQRGRLEVLAEGGLLGLGDVAGLGG
jgi:hypothetical protein